MSLAFQKLLRSDIFRRPAHPALEDGMWHPIFVAPAPAGHFCATCVWFALEVIKPMASSPERTISATTSHMSGRGRTYKAMSNCLRTLVLTAVPKFAPKAGSCYFYPLAKTLKTSINLPFTSSGQEAKDSP